MVSDEVDARLKAGIQRLQPNDWQSGPHPWIVEVGSPFGDAERVVEEVIKAVFDGKKVPVLGVTRDE